MLFGKKSIFSVMPGLGLAAVLLFAGMIVGCAQEVSVDEKFVNLFVEMRLAEITYGKDSPMGRLVRQDALKAAGYTREQFLAKADEILDDERLWMPFQKAVSARIDSLLAEPKQEDASAKETPVKKSAPKQAPSKEAPSKEAPSKAAPVNAPVKKKPLMPAHKGGVP